MKKNEQKNVHASMTALDVIVIIDRYRNKHVFILPHSSLHLVTASLELGR